MADWTKIFEGITGDVPLVFAGSPLDRTEDRREDEAWLQARLDDPASRFVVFSGGKPLMTINPGLDIAVLDIARAGPYLAADAMTLFMGCLGEVAYFALALPEGAEAAFADDGKFIDARGIAMQWGLPERDRGRGAMIAQAKALLDWHQRNAYCASCGGRTVSIKAGYARRCIAVGDLQGCGAEHFPRTDPVVIMLVTRGEECLLGRQAEWPPGMYSALAGFMEPGESIEEAVRREVAEEAGITVGAVRYFASQPWPFPSSIMIGCFAEALDYEIRLDERELEDARWASRQDVLKALNAEEGAFMAVPSQMAIASVLLRKWAMSG